MLKEKNHIGDIWKIFFVLSLVITLSTFLFKQEVSLFFLKSTTKVYAENTETISVAPYTVGEATIQGVATVKVRKCVLKLNDEQISETQVQKSGAYELYAHTLYGKITKDSTLTVTGYDALNNIVKEIPVSFTIDEDRQQVLTPIGTPYQAVCAIKGMNVNTGDGFTGSGFIVGKNLVLTNKHVVPTTENKLVRVYPGATIPFFNPADSEKYFKVTKIIPYPGAEDLTLLELNKNSLGQSVGDIIPPLKLKKLFSNEIGTPLSFVGYPGDKPWPTMWLSKGKVITNHSLTPKVEDSSIISDAYIYGGSSGSPIFSSNNEVVGVANMIADVQVGDKSRNACGVRFTSEIYDFIQKQIAIDVDLPSNIVNIPDENLKQILKKSLGISEDKDITELRLYSLSGALNLSNKRIQNLEGLEFTSITSLDLSHNPLIKDFSVLKQFSELKKLDVSYCDIYNLSVLNDLNIVREFILKGNHIKDLTPLKNKQVWQNYDATEQTITTEQVSIENEGISIVCKIKDLDDKIPGETNDHWMIYPKDNGVFDEKTKTISWNAIPLGTKTLSYDFGDKLPIDECHQATLFTGTVTIPITEKSTTADPQWYSFVPATVSMNNNTKKVDVNIKLSKYSDKYEVYDGAKTVNVTVKSINGYQLKDGSKKEVTYTLTPDGESALKATDLPQALGSLSITTPELKATVAITGESSKTGKYTDVLTYNFSEQ